MTPQEYRERIADRHPHVGLPDDKGKQETQCTCGWTFRHPLRSERRAALLEHLYNPTEQ